MKFYRIEPFQQETLYVLCEDGQDLGRIANNPVCFSPISYQTAEVESGDIPVHAKIVSIEGRSGRLKRVNLETAIKMSEGQDIAGANDVAAAIETLKAAFQRNGLDSPLSIQLQDSDQAVKLAMLFGDRLSNGSMARLVGSISTNRDSFLINGIRFFWPLKPETVRKTRLQRLKQIFGAGGDLDSVTAKE
jgi:hypothetical protein